MIKAAYTSDLSVIQSMLAANHLPTADIHDPSIQFWMLYKDDGTTIGCIALQRIGDFGLLRSLVVDEKERGKGFGIELVKSLEEESRQAGVKELYLLTETASVFFKSLGYEETARSSAPSAMLNTQEFTALCADTAVCMRKQL